MGIVVVHRLYMRNDKYIPHEMTRKVKLETWRIRPQQIFAPYKTCTHITYTLENYGRILDKYEGVLVSK